VFNATQKEHTINYKCLKIVISNVYVLHNMVVIFKTTSCVVVGAVSRYVQILLILKYNTKRTEEKCLCSLFVCVNSLQHRRDALPGI